MSNLPQPSELTEQQVVEKIYLYTAQQFDAGVSGPQIVEELVERGLPREDAALVVRQTREARMTAVQGAGRKNMLYGALWCIGGLAVTIISYQAAAGGGGGKYVVTWGAVIFGAVQFFQGLAQSMRR